MKKILLVVALIAIVISAQGAHFFKGVKCTKTLGVSTATYIAVRDTNVVHHDSVRCRVVITDDTISGLRFGGLWVSGVFDTITNTIPIGDTMREYFCIEAIHYDTALHVFITDTSFFTPMGKWPGVEPVVSATTDSIHYSVTFNQSNITTTVSIEYFGTDSTYSLGAVLQSHVVSGAVPVTYAGYVPATLSECTKYYLRFKAVNAVGSVSVKDTQMTICPFAHITYLEWSDTLIHDDHSGTFYPGINCFGRNATVNINWKKVSETGWHVKHVIIDTTMTGLQTPTVVIDSFVSSTNYMYYLSAVNIVGPVNLGMKYFTTDDTIVGSGTTGTLSLTSVSAVYNSPDSVIFKDYLTNVSGGTATLNAQMTKNGVIVSTVDPITSSIDHGTIRMAFPTMGDTGTFMISSWVYDDKGSTDSVGGYVLYSRVLTVHVSGKNTTGIINVTVNKNIHGSVVLFSEIGKKVCEYKCMFGEINNFIPEKNTLYISNFISDDGQFTNRQKIFVQR